MRARATIAPVIARGFVERKKEKKIYIYIYRVIKLEKKREITVYNC